MYTSFIISTFTFLFLRYAAKVFERLELPFEVDRLNGEFLWLVVNLLLGVFDYDQFKNSNIKIPI